MILLHKIKDFFVGILLGAGAILPGVSSGVLCVIFGMYNTLINSIFGLFKNFKKNFSYLFPIGLGGILGVFIFGNILNSLFEYFPMQTSFTFIGLILGSIPLLIKKINKEQPFKLRYLFFVFFSFLIGCFLVFLENKLSLSTNIQTLSTSYLIFSGFLMSIGVVFPGVSNTLILMCMRCVSSLFSEHSFS